MVNYKLRAKDIMQVEVATILDDASLSEAAGLMRAEGVRSLVVEPHDEHDPYGIVTFSITIQPEMEVKYIARLFQQTSISHLPVMNGSKLAGIISMTDLVTEMIAEPD